MTEREPRVMTLEEVRADRIQACIDHIKSSVDVDPWAVELAEKALRAYAEPRRSAVQVLGQKAEGRGEGGEGMG